MPKKFKVTVIGHVGGIPGKTKASFILIGSKYENEMILKGEVAIVMNVLGFDGKRGFSVLTEPVRQEQ